MITDLCALCSRAYENEYFLVRLAFPTICFCSKERERERGRVRVHKKFEDDLAMGKKKVGLCVCEKVLKNVSSLDNARE